MVLYSKSGMKLVIDFIVEVRSESDRLERQSKHLNGSNILPLFSFNREDMRFAA